MKQYSLVITLTRKDNGNKIYLAKGAISLVEDGVKGGSLVYVGKLTREVKELPADIAKHLIC